MKLTINGTAKEIKGMPLNQYMAGMQALPRRGCIGDEYQELGSVIKEGVIVARFEARQQGCPGCKLYTSWEARDLCVQSLPSDWNGLCAYL